jgi:hypothetical protein
MIGAILFDYDGVFTKDNYDDVVKAFQESSGLSAEEINRIIGENERKWVLSPSSKGFLSDLKREFNFPGTSEEIVELLNQREDSGLYQEMYRFVRWKDDGQGRRALAILSNQLAYRIPHVRQELERGVGLENFVRVWFSPEVGLQKPFVGVTHDDEKSGMDTSRINIFPVVVQQIGYMGYMPDECLFVDDSQRNIRSAQAEGLNGLVFRDINQMVREMADRYQIIV